MRVLFCTFAVLLSTFSFAQQAWQLNEVGFGAGNVNDRIQNMSMDWMRMYAHTDDAFQVDLDGYEYSPYADFIGTSLNLDLTFTNTGAIGASTTTQELRVGARLITGREAMISFDREEDRTTDTYRESLIFCLVDDEVAWDAAYIVRKTYKKLSIYTGVAGMFGTTFSSKLLRIRNGTLTPNNVALEEATPNEVENTTDIFQAKNSAFYRVQVPIGIEFHSRKLAIGPEFRIGVGGHSVYGGNSYLIAPGTSFTMRLSYFLRR